MHKRKKMKSQFKWFTLSLLIAMVFGTRMQASGTTKANLKNEEGSSTCNVQSSKQYTLVIKNYGEYTFEGKTLTKDLNKQVEFYIKDNEGNEYYAEKVEQEIPELDPILTIMAENHIDLPTYKNGSYFFLAKGGKWEFVINEGASGNVTLTVNPKTHVDTEYFISDKGRRKRNAFVNNMITVKLTTAPFLLLRNDDFGLMEMAAAESTRDDGFCFWEFDKNNRSAKFIPGARTNQYRVEENGTYTFKLDTDNNTISLASNSDKQFSLVTKEGDEYAFDELTLTQELPAKVGFIIKDNNGKEYYASEDISTTIIREENHIDVPTYQSGKCFYISKANTWTITLNETKDDGLTLTVVPQSKGETKYMITESLDKESEDVFVDNKLTKEMTTKPFFIVRSDDYGIFELTAVERNDQKGYYIWEFGKENNTIGFIIGERRNMYRVEEDGIYTFTLDHDQNTVSSILTSNTAYNDSSTAVTSIYSDDNWSIDEDGAWYTIDGRECNGKPTQKGLYIHNGRKVTIN